MLGLASSPETAMGRPPSAHRALEGVRHWPAIAAALLVFVLASSIALLWHTSTGQLPPRIATPRRLVPRESLSILPLAAQSAVSATLGARDRAYWIGTAGSGFAARSPAQHLSMRFGRSGVQVSSGGLEFGLSLRAAGYGSSLRAVGGSVPIAQVNRVIYRHAGVGEWYVNGPLGLEQGFTIARAPVGRGTGPLTLSLGLSGDAHVALAADGRSLTLHRAGSPSLRYGGLIATDARGRPLHSQLALGGGRLLLRVWDRGAVYPLRVDPFIQQGSKLTASGETTEGVFGVSIALSADGNTALIGASGNTNSIPGAAYVFQRSGTTWPSRVLRSRPVTAASPQRASSATASRCQPTATRRWSAVRSTTTRPAPPGFSCAQERPGNSRAQS
jgi:FG-GAP repeat